MDGWMDGWMDVWMCACVRVRSSSFVAHVPALPKRATHAAIMASSRRRRRVVVVRPGLLVEEGSVVAAGSVRTMREERG